MTTVIHDFPDTQIFERVIAPEDPSLSPQLAYEILKWRFPESDHESMDELAAKARAGTMTEQERLEAESFDRVGSFITILKSKARRTLQHR